MSSATLCSWRQPSPAGNPKAGGRVQPQEVHGGGGRGGAVVLNTHSASTVQSNSAQSVNVSSGGVNVSSGNHYTTVVLM